MRKPLAFEPNLIHKNKNLIPTKEGLDSYKSVKNDHLIGIFFWVKLPTHFPVIPAKAGIRSFGKAVDLHQTQCSRLRWNDPSKKFKLFQEFEDSLTYQLV